MKKGNLDINVSLDDDDDEDKRFRLSSCVKVFVALGVLFLIAVVVIIGLLIAAAIIAATMEPPKYVDPTVMDALLSQPDMNGSEFNQLPAILGTAITFHTVSYEAGSYNETAFEQLHAFLKSTFKNVFNSDIVQVDQKYASILLTVNGNQSNNSYLLLAHMDVVPVNPDLWTVEPFGGVWEQEGDEDNFGRVYGRGALDDKLSVVAILCALDELLASGWTPNTTFYIALGHDEEVSGFNGAGELAKILESRGVEDLFFVLDEGLVVVDGIVDGVDKPVSMIGVTEKGSLTLRLEATGVAGHSSMPPPEQAIHKLSRAIHKLTSSPHPAMISGGVQEAMYRAIAPESNWPMRLVLSNPWLFNSIISHVMSQKKETDASQRTTTAVTVVNGGVKENVIPGTAYAVVNHRVHPGQTIDEVLAHDVAAIDDPSINITVLGAMDPHPVSPYQPSSSPALSLIASLAAKVYPDSIPTPGMLIANTDTRHYLQFSPNVFRFLPYRLTGADLRGIHGHDESVSAANVWRAARFYHSLMLAVDGGSIQRSVQENTTVREL